MKLRTEMVQTCCHAIGYCIDYDDVHPKQARDLEHDAAAAHALLQAMEEWRALPAHNHAAQWSVEWIHGRANGLMREWTGQ